KKQLDAPTALVNEIVREHVSVLFGNRDGTFSSPVTYSVPTGPTSIVAADFNGDLNLDLAVASTTSSDASFAVDVAYKAIGGVVAAIKYNPGAYCCNLAKPQSREHAMTLKEAGEQGEKEAVEIIPCSEQPVSLHI